MNIAVLLMTYGTPENLEDMGAYLLDIRHGRPASQEFVEEIKRRYKLVGGSPLLKITQKQAEQLESQLNSKENHYKVYLGMRHWKPYIKEALQIISQDNFDHLISFPLTPYYSKMSTEAYHQGVTDALKDLSYHPSVTRIKSWNKNPYLIDCFTLLVKEAFKKFDEPEKVKLLFTAHSLPERILKTQDPYPTQILETARMVAEKLGRYDYSFAFQSQGGSAEPWLGPTVEETLESFSKQGIKEILISPIGFLSDHVEVLYDIDVLFKGLAKDKGLHLERTNSPNIHPLFINALTSVVLENSLSPINTSTASLN